MQTSDDDYTFFILDSTYDKNMVIDFVAKCVSSNDNDFAVSVSYNERVIQMEKAMIHILIRD